MCVTGSDAALIVAWPNPDQTGVVGLKAWVRSTSFLLAITLYASARDISAAAGQLATAGNGRDDDDREPNDA